MGKTSSASFAVGQNDDDRGTYSLTPSLTGATGAPEKIADISLVCSCGKPVFIKKCGLCKTCYQANRYRRSTTDARVARLARAAERDATRTAQADERRSAKRAVRFAYAESLAARVQAGEKMSGIGLSENISRQRVREILVEFGFQTFIRKTPVFKRQTEEDKTAKRVARAISAIKKYMPFGEPDSCWVWTGPTQDTSNGRCQNHRYGRAYAPTPLYGGGPCRQTYVHRVVYEMFHGPIAEGMTVDHICWNPLCCNPAHLQLLTRAQNSARKSPASIAKYQATKGIPRPRKVA